MGFPFLDAVTISMSFVIGGSLSSGNSQYPWNIDNIGVHKFTLAHNQTPESYVTMQFAMFCDEVTRLSDGKITFDQRVAGTLLADNEALDGVMNGVADFVHIKASQHVGTIPDLSPMTLVGLHDFSDWEGFCADLAPILDDIYAEYGIKHIGLLPETYTLIVNTIKPIRKPSDTIGMTFRASGRWTSLTVSAWGSAATTIPLPDLADAFNRGSVDGVMVGWNIVVPFAIYEVTPYVSVTDLTENGSSLVMTKSTFDKLNADEQALLEYVGHEWQFTTKQVTFDWCDQYRKFIEGEGRNEIIDLTPEECAEFRRLALGLLDDMIPELSPLGIQLVNILKDYHGIPR